MKLIAQRSLLIPCIVLAIASLGSLATTARAQTVNWEYVEELGGQNVMSFF
jgi:hypothetical protein